MRGTAAALTGESGAVGTSAATAFGGGFNRVLSGGLIAAGVVAATGASLIAIGSQFDDAYDAIQTGTGATGDALAGLKDVFRDVVADVPTDFDSAAEAISMLNTRLELTGAPLEDLSEQFLNLSHITGDDLSRNLDGVTRAFGDWSVATEDQSDVLDRFFRASQDSGVAVGELAEGVVQFGSPLRQLGFTLDESIALFASFGEAGVNTSTVMAGMRQAVKNFGSGFAEAETGMASFDEVLWQVEHGMFTLSDAMTIFGTRAGPDMYAALQEGRFELGDFLEAMRATGGGINETAEDTRDFGESFTLLKNNIMLLLEGPATSLMGWLSDAAEGLAEFSTLVREDGWGAGFDEVRGKLGQMNPLVWVAIAAVSTLTLAFFAVKIAAVGAWIASLGPLAVVIGLIIAAGVVTLLLVQNWDDVKGGIESATSSAEANIPGITGLVGELGQAFSDIMGSITSIPNGIGFIVDVIQGDFAGAWDRVVDQWSNTLGRVPQMVGAVFAVVSSVLSGAMSAIGSAMSSAWSAIVGLVRAAWESIKGATQSGIGSVVSFIQGLPGRAVSAISPIVSGLTNKGREAMQGMFNAIRDVWGNISGWLGGLPGRIVSAVGSLASVLYSAGRAAIQSLWDGMRSVADGMIGWAQGIADTIGGILSGLNPFESGSIDVTASGGPTLSAIPVEAVSSRYSGQHTETRVVVEANGVDSALVEFLRRAVRVESGGDVQAYLGA